MYYIQVKDKNIIGKGQVKCLNEEVENIEVSKDVYDNLDRYIYQDGEIVENPNYEEEQKQKEREKIALLSLTRGDVFRGLLQAKGVTRVQLRAMIETNESLTEVQREMALIDFDEALNFYRGNELINTVGLALGITTEQLDKFFETNDYTELISSEQAS